MPRDALDVVVSKRLGKAWEVKIRAKDLLCDRVELCQFPRFTGDDGRTHERREVTKAFDPGRSFSVSVSLNF